MISDHKTRTTNTVTTKRHSTKTAGTPVMSPSTTEKNSSDTPCESEVVHPPKPKRRKLTHTPSTTRTQAEEVSTAAAGSQTTTTPNVAVIPPPCWNNGRYDFSEMFAYLNSLPPAERLKVLKFMNGGEDLPLEDSHEVPWSKIPHESLEDIEEMYGVNL